MPYELVFGRLPPGPVYVDAIREGKDDGKEGDEVQDLKDEILSLQQIAHQNQTAALSRQVSYHDAHARAHDFKIGDSVWVYRQSDVEKGVTSKLLFRWKGPYTIREKVGDVTYILEGEDGKRVPGTVHARHLYKPPA